MRRQLAHTPWEYAHMTQAKQPAARVPVTPEVFEGGEEDGVVREEGLFR